jgi:hypothetical protein
MLWTLPLRNAPVPEVDPRWNVPDGLRVTPLSEVAKVLRSTVPDTPLSQLRLQVA